MWQSNKVKWENSTGKLKEMCGSQYMEKECDIHPDEKKYGSDNPRRLRWSQINTSGTVSQT